MGRLLSEVCGMGRGKKYHSRLGHLHDVGKVHVLVGGILHQRLHVGRGRTVLKVNDVDLARLQALPSAADCAQIQNEAKVE